MYQCPECLIKLRQIRSADRASYWGCENCSGRMIGFGAIKTLVSPDASNAIWQASQRLEANGRPCPSCARPLKTLLHQSAPAAVELDVCNPCYIAWLDQGEETSIKTVRETRKKLNMTPEQTREYATALAALTKQAEESKSEDDPNAPAATWKWVPALMGLPVELHDKKLRHLPFLSWSIVAASIIALLMAAAKGQDFFNHYGFVSAAPFALSGLTLLTSFFLHAGFLHFIGNMYFYLVFADDVEDDLSGVQFLLLTFGSHFAGLFLQYALQGPTEIPLVGASAGVFGILAYYMVRFPRARVGVMYFFIWFRFNAAWIVAFKIAWEVVMSSWVRGDQGAGVAHAAHVGGAIFGAAMAFALESRRKPIKP